MSRESSLLLLILTLASTLEVIQAQCKPGDNCKPPDCRCWNDPQIPGGLVKEVTPQIVLLSFAYGITANKEFLYTSIFDNINNPNGCPAKGSFFVQKLDTQFDVIKTLHDRKHEIGVTSADGIIPSSSNDWIQSFQDVKVELEQNRIPPDEILGSRAPELFLGGDDQLEAMKTSQLVYDSSCVSQKYISPSNLLWPFTYDFVEGVPVCSSGSEPTKPFPGFWQFYVADLQLNGRKCATPSSCSPFINTTQESFDLLFNAFADHYEGSRAPFVLYIDPLWLTVDYQLEGTRQFLEFVRSGFDDTWVLTYQQALQWMKQPVDSDTAAKDYDPWKC